MEELIKKAQKGDINAFTNMIFSIKHDLYKVAKTRLTSEDDIEDMIQETMIQVYKSIKKLKEPEKFKKWTITILINKCNKLYKKKYKGDVSIDEYNLEKYMIINSQEDIEDDLNFYYLIKNLKYEERIIILLYYMEQYDIDEIAKMLKMNKNTAKSHLHRAKCNIKNNLLKEEL